MSILDTKLRIASEHLFKTSACRSRSVKCRHVNKAPIWTSEILFVKMCETAPAISSALGFASAADSCQRRLRRGVMEILGSSSISFEAMIGD